MKTLQEGNVLLLCKTLTKSARNHKYFDTVAIVSVSYK